MATPIDKIVAENPGKCKCGHESKYHGFGMGECWACAFDDSVPDCDSFEVEEKK